MKLKISQFLFVLLLTISIIIPTVSASTNLKFSLNNLYTAEKTSTFFCSFDSRFNPSKDNESIELLIITNLVTTKQGSITTAYRQFNNFQINNYRDRAFIFSDIEFLTDTSLSISNELSYGLGIGYSTFNESSSPKPSYKFQTGLYARSATEIDTLLISKSKLAIKIPVVDIVNLISDTNFDINTDSISEYRMNSVLCCRIDQSFITYEIGGEINYINEVDPEAINTTKRFYVTAGLSF